MWGAQQKCIEKVIELNIYIYQFLTIEFSKNIIHLRQYFEMFNLLIICSKIFLFFKENNPKANALNVDDKEVLWRGENIMERKKHFCWGTRLNRTKHPNSCRHSQDLVRAAKIHKLPNSRNAMRWTWLRYGENTQHPPASELAECYEVDARKVWR